MALAQRLVQPLAIVTPTAGAEDQDGLPTSGAPTVTPVLGLVQPKSAREIAALSQAGADIGTYTILLLPRAVAPGAWVRDEPDAGRRFDITGIRPYEFGRDPHLELDARLVTAGPETPA
jgi:hypothetical protein